MTDPTSEKEARRRIIKRLIAGGGITATAHLLPDKWSKPVIESVVLPAHAQSSPSDDDDDDDDPVNSTTFGP